MNKYIIFTFSLLILFSGCTSLSSNTQNELNKNNAQLSYPSISLNDDGFVINENLGPLYISDFPITWKALGGNIKTIQNVTLEGFIEGFNLYFEYTKNNILTQSVARFYNINTMWENYTSMIYNIANEKNISISNSKDIGDKAIFYSVNYNNSLGNNVNFNHLEFVKGDVYQHLSSEEDFEFLFSLARIIVNRIDNYNLQSQIPISSVPSNDYTNYSWNKIESIFYLDSSYTDLQINAIMNEVSSKWIKGTGEVKSVDDVMLSNDYVVTLKDPTNRFNEIALLYFGESEYNSLLQINEGDEINFNCKIEGKSTFGNSLILKQCTLIDESIINLNDSNHYYDNIKSLIVSYSRSQEIIGYSFDPNIFISVETEGIYPKNSMSSGYINAQIFNPITNECYTSNSNSIIDVNCAEGWIGNLGDVKTSLDCLVDINLLNITNDLILRVYVGNVTKRPGLMYGYYSDNCFKSSEDILNEGFQLIEFTFNPSEII
ncbi:MAG: hypothetical protein WC393_00100 [Candidatus Nanoarchaeia archaeon]|jgi:hypothetical protein